MVVEEFADELHARWQLIQYRMAAPAPLLLPPGRKTVATFSSFLPSRAPSWRRLFARGAQLARCAELWRRSAGC